jgi:hypothetical protein
MFTLYNQDCQSAILHSAQTLHLRISYDSQIKQQPRISVQSTGDRFLK